MEYLSIKVRGPSGSAGLSVPVSTTFGQLKAKIAESLEIEQDSFDIMIGFPPTVSVHGDDESIENIVKNNDNVRVQLKEFTGVQAQGKPKPTKGNNKFHLLKSRPKQVYLVQIFPR